MQKWINRTPTIPFLKNIRFINCAQIRDWHSFNMFKETCKMFSEFSLKNYKYLALFCQNALYTL